MECWHWDGYRLRPVERSRTRNLRGYDPSAAAFTKSDRSLHERQNGDKNPFVSSIQPVSSVEIETLTSNDDTFVQDREPREP